MTSTELLCYYMYFESNAHDKGLLFTYIAHRCKQMAHLSRVPNTRFYNMVTFPHPFLLSKNLEKRYFNFPDDISMFL
mgnify:CR=1 FL=1